MRTRVPLFALLLSLVLAVPASAQLTPWYHWTFLPGDVMDEIVGEASGETAWNTIMETGGYNKDRPASEYGGGTFYEAQYIHDQLMRYALPGAEIVRFPGGRVWDGEEGELWEISPMRRKLASYQDMRAMLAKGSSPADVTAQLVWVGSGREEDLADSDIAGKIVVTEGSMGGVHRAACLERDAAGVLSIGNSRPFFDPLQIPWSSVGGGRDGQPARFGFFLPPREGETLKARLLAGEEITVHAVVEASMQPYDLQDVTAHIPGTDPDAGEVIFSAHLFEGYTKQGANDNKSGSAAILEVARTLHTLIEEGRIPRPRRTIRFIWGPEFSGIGPWVKANRELMEETLCNINMDMVGEWLSLNQAFMNLMRTTYGQPHYINDVMENYFRFVGESNRERVQNRSGFYKVPRRIVAPSGADEPFYYSIETHYGSSDHEVFNDPGVQVPGVMMIAWPDRWYHTSGDRVDKADPTQLKRVVIIGAASAYTIASADDDMAVRIAGEIASNGTRRLGHQFVRALEEVNNAGGSSLGRAWVRGRVYIDAARWNEQETLASVTELADDAGKVGAYVAQMKETVDAVADAHLEALDAHVAAAADRLGVGMPRVRATDLERRASRIVPRQTDRVKADGYGGWRRWIDQVPEEEAEEYPYSRRDVADTSEVLRLVDGQHSVLQIKQMLDAQERSASDLQALLNYLEVMKLAGLVEF
ncbi:MAG: M28 family peptidase [bacterium]